MPDLVELDNKYISVQDPVRLARLSSTSVLPGLRTLTPSRSSAPRAGSSREPEAGDSPEDTRSKLSSVHVLLVIVVFTLCVLSTLT